MDRPYSNANIKELAALVEKSKQDSGLFWELFSELRYRRGPLARKLEARLNEIHGISCDPHRPNKMMAPGERPRRKYQGVPIEELERLARASAGRHAALRELLDELKYRRSKRSKALAAEIQSMREALKGRPAPRIALDKPSDGRRSPMPMHPAPGPQLAPKADARRPAAPYRAPIKPNEPEPRWNGVAEYFKRCFSTWMAMFWLFFKIGVGCVALGLILIASRTAIGLGGCLFALGALICSAWLPFLWLGEMNDRYMWPDWVGFLLWPALGLSVCGVLYLLMKAATGM